MEIESKLDHVRIVTVLMVCHTSVLFRCKAHLDYFKLKKAQALETLGSINCFLYCLILTSERIVFEGYVSVLAEQSPICSQMTLILL